MKPKLPATSQIPDYTYHATKVDPGLWMVKRYEAGRNHSIYSEALIRVDTVDESEAVKMAIMRGSWA